MTHEPECDDHALVPRAGWTCICRQVQAAYERGFDQGRDYQGTTNQMNLEAKYERGYNHGYLARLQEEYALDEGNPYNEAQRHALSAAAKRVETLLDQGDCPECSYTSRDQEIIAAIMGEI